MIEGPGVYILCACALMWESEPRNVVVPVRPLINNIRPCKNRRISIARFSTLEKRFFFFLFSRRMNQRFLSSIYLLPMSLVNKRIRVIFANESFHRVFTVFLFFFFFSYSRSKYPRDLSTFINGLIQAQSHLVNLLFLTVADFSRCVSRERDSSRLNRAARGGTMNNLSR